MFNFWLPSGMIYGAIHRNQDHATIDFARI
nr:MAG TPA: hypothetical protein [Caudoviricetes sp.]